MEGIPAEILQDWEYSAYHIYILSNKLSRLVLNILEKRTNQLSLKIFNHSLFSLLPHPTQSYIWSTNLVQIRYRRLSQRPTVISRCTSRVKATIQTICKKVILFHKKVHLWVGCLECHIYNFKFYTIEGVHFSPTKLHTTHPFSFLLSP